MYFDVIVIGGGPGGAVCSGFLAKLGYRVAVFEKEVFPRYHVGESLVPTTTLGILELLGAANKVSNFGFTRKYGGMFKWGANKEPWPLQFYRRPGTGKLLGDHPTYLHSYQVTRADFDKLLLDHAESLGVEVYYGHLTEEATSLGDVKTVKVWDKGTDQKKVVQAKFVVDASGRNGLLSNVVGERIYDPFFRNIAVFAYFENGKRFDGDLSGNIFSISFGEGWSWYIPLRNTGDFLTSVGLVVDADTLRGVRDLKEFYTKKTTEIPELVDLLSDARRCNVAPYDRIRVEKDYSYCNSKFADQGIFLSGDAACFIDPIFSSGIHLATYSGYLAANAIGDIFTGKKSETQSASDYDCKYRREYSLFQTFLLGFYNINKQKESYYWDARRLLGEETANLFRDDESFVKLVSGFASQDEAILEALFDSVGKSSAAIEAYVKKHTAGDVLNAAEEKASVEFFGEFGKTPNEIYELASRERGLRT